MTNKLTLCMGFLLAALLVLPGFMAPDPGIKVKFPKKVNTTIQDKCYGCHSPEGRSEKAKNKLLWDNLATMDFMAQRKAFASIEKVIQEGTMPPKGMVERNPDMKLTDREAAKLEKWASKMHRKVSKQLK